jgi:hypothetical protein
VQSLCSLCLCGKEAELVNHGGTENTEIAQRKTETRLIQSTPLKSHESLQESLKQIAHQNLN